MNIKEVLAEKLKNDATFQEKLMRAPKETLSECGIDTESEEAQALLTEISRATVKTIGKQELDSEELAKVAGAGAGFCFFEENCDALFNDHPEISSHRRCNICLYCDQFYGHYWGGEEED